MKPPLKSAMLYLATAIATTYTAYNHLDFTASGIGNVDISALRAAWPVLFLLVSIQILLLGAVITFRQPMTGARIAWVGAASGCAYFIVTIPPLFCYISILVFITPKGVLANVIPGLLLLATLMYSRRIARMFMRITLPSGVGSR